MKKKLSKGFALMVAAVLSVSMTTTPMVQAVTIEDPQIKIEMENSSSDNISMEESELSVDKASSEIGQSKDAGNVEMTSQFTEESNGGQISEPGQAEEEMQEATTSVAEAVSTEMEEATEEFDMIQATATEGTCGKNLTWHITDDGILYIDGTGEMDDFSLSPWYQHEETIREVYLSDGITSIGKEAFAYCSNLTQISIPQTVTHIGAWAFSHCSSLREIVIPENVISIGDNVFYNCSSLSMVNIPGTVTSIGDSAFDGCGSLSSIMIPEGVTSIGDSAFYDCSGLSEISIPKSVASIGMWAFAYCNNLSKITILNKNCQIYSVPDTISDTAIIYGYSNSTAQKYAKSYSKRFKALDVQSITYKITYNANGGKNAPAAQTKEKNIVLTLNKLKPTRKGYTFLGWATSKTSTKVAYAAGANFRENKNMTLYAVWKANTYKIAFKENGGTGSMATMSCTYGKSYTLRANTFKRTGYTFTGWGTKADGTGMYNYTDKEKVKNVSSIAGKTMKLYAQWKPKKYTITYQLNGSKNNAENPASYKITNSTITLKKPTKKGYTFAGWYTSSNYKTKVTKITKGSTGNKTFYAKWTVNKYTIRYNGNGATGGKMSDTVQCQYNKSYTLRKNAFVRKGYTFVGWTGSEQGVLKYKDQAKVKNISSINGKIVTLYAVWKKNA